ncbi:VRR-NUC domain-containing protein [Clostridium sp. DL1XJH146]
MTEKEVEQMLVKKTKGRGGWALKFISPGINGVPDRLVLMPTGKIAFVELKAPGKKMRPLQIKRKSQLEALGFLVYCIDNPKQIGGVLDEIENGVPTI